MVSAPGGITIAVGSSISFDPTTSSGSIEITSFYVRVHVWHTSSVVFTTTLSSATNNTSCHEGKVSPVTTGSAIGGSSNTVSDLSPTPGSGTGIVGVGSVMVSS